MNCVSGKEWLVIILLGPPTRTIWMRGSYLCKEFNIIWKTAHQRQDGHFMYLTYNSRVFHFEMKAWNSEKSTEETELCLYVEKTKIKHHRIFSAYLTSSVELIGEFDFTKGDGSLHPVRPEVWRVRMDVHAAGGLRLRFASRDPLPVHVFPPVVVRRYEVQQKGIHGVRVQSWYVNFQHRKHAPW